MVDYVQGLVHGQPLTRIPIAAQKVLMSSVGSASVGPSSTARVGMLPGVGTILLPANAMPDGAMLKVEGFGDISAASVGAGNFEFTPWMSYDGGITKVDLPGRVVAPLIGVVGICEIVMFIRQLGGNVKTGGRVKYGIDNMDAMYPVVINTGNTLVTSDPTVPRTFGIDGRWANSNAANYLVVKDVAVTLAS